MRILLSFLANEAREPFRYGHSDCALLIANWWLAATGSDPAAHLRGAYVTRDECLALVRAHNGLPALIARLAKKAGARHVAEPSPGCFAVVRYESGHHGAIRTPTGKWALKTERGLAALATVHVVAMWSSPCDLSSPRG